MTEHGKRMTQPKKVIYSISQLVPYINWRYFYFAWQVTDRAERRRLRAEAERLLGDMDGRYHAYALCLLAEAYGDGDDLLLNGERLPLLRQQHAEKGKPCLCLSDFVRPVEQGVPDTVGVFATSVDRSVVTDSGHDDYQKMMAQLLADRLAEAAAERVHEQVRRTDWGYAPNERLTVEQLHAERFQGIRPAVGYPSLPDTSVNFLIDRLLHLADIGIRLTESGAMIPHASVSGLMLAHPEARYFTIGSIDETQLADYAGRRGLPVELLRKFLGGMVAHSTTAKPL